MQKFLFVKNRESHNRVMYIGYLKEGEEIPREAYDNFVFLEAECKNCYLKFERRIYLINGTKYIHMRGFLFEPIS